MFTQNSISKDLQDSIRKVMEATNVTVHNGEAEGSVPKTPREKELAAKHGNKNRITMGDVLKARGVVQKEEVVQADEATALERLKGVGGPRAAQNLPMGHAGKVTMKHVMKSDATPQVKAAIKKAAPDIKTYGDRAAALNAAGIRREEVEQQNEAKSESKKDFQARQERLAAAAAQTAKDPARLKRMMSIPGYSAAMGLANKTTTKEEVEELDELSRTTLGSYAKKATRDATITRKIAADFEHQGKRAKSPGMKAASDMLSQRYKAKSFKRRDGVDSAVNRLVKEDAEQFDETVLVHATYEIKDSYTFGEYLTTAKNLVGDEGAVELANEAFKVQDTDIFAEELSSMDIMSRINSHRKAGHTVTEPKYSTKAGKPYHEYVVTDKESGTRRKYIHHGDVSKVENMGAKPKKDEQ